VERTMADRHSLDVSDQVHQGLIDIADTVRQGREVPAEAVDPVTMALALNARSMLDIDYAGSPLVADYVADGSDNPEPHPGLPGLDAVWRDFPPRACFWPRKRQRSPDAAGATLVQARGDFSRPRCRSRPRRPPDGRRGSYPTRWPYRVPVPVRRGERFRRPRPPPLCVSDSGLTLGPLNSGRPYPNTTVASIMRQ
jgi:hypothetical protein